MIRLPRTVRVELTDVGHNRVMTFAPVALAALKAFGMEDDQMSEVDRAE